MEKTKNYDISKSVRFDSRKLATIGKFLTRECNYTPTTSTDLIRTAIDKLCAFVVTSGYEEVKSFAGSRQWFMNNGLGDLFKQGNQVNRAHVIASAKENELFAAFRNKQSEDTTSYEQSMIDAIADGEEVTIARPHSVNEPESRRGDIDGIKNLMNDVDALIEGDK